MRLKYHKYAKWVGNWVGGSQALWYSIRLLRGLTWNRAMSYHGRVI